MIEAEQKEEKMNNLTILKIGGSVITDRKSSTPKVDYKNLKRIAKEVSAYKGKLILIHGAGSYGHQIVKKTGIHKGIKNKKQVLTFAETQKLQNELNAIVCSALIKEGVPAIPVQPSASAVMSKGKMKKMNYEVVEKLLEIGLVPVLYGVPAYDENQKCSILSGDEIAPYLALKLNAKRIIHGTNVDGVFTADPNKNKNAKLIPLITKGNLNEVKKAISGSTSVDVTGGMMKKINELMKLQKKGVTTLIVNAEKKGLVKKALLGEKVRSTIVR